MYFYSYNAVQIYTLGRTRRGRITVLQSTHKLYYPYKMYYPSGSPSITFLIITCIITLLCRSDTVCEQHSSHFRNQPRSCDTTILKFLDQIDRNKWVQKKKIHLNPFDQLNDPKDRRKNF